MNHVRILIVDADIVDRNYYKQMLTDHLNISSEILEADNAKSALELLQKDKFDCIVLDYLLPDMNGIELVKTIKINCPHFMPIIMLSNQGDENIAVTAMKEGVTDYLVKSQQNPFTLTKIILNAIEKNQLDTRTLQKEAEIKYYAYYDNLTGVMNRHAFAETAVREISHTKRHYHLLAILYIDLDNFNTINDTYGRLAGDDILKQVAIRMTGLLRKEDVVARLGGDEFAVLLAEFNSIADVDNVANKLLNEIAQPYQLADGTTVYTNASIGIACFPEAGDNLTELLKNADIALYSAKEVSHGKIQFYTDEIKKLQGQRLYLEHALQSAIKNKELFLVYQPKFELSTRKLVGLETLLRWQHPEFGILTPDKFISIAEETRMIAPIGQWVLETASQQLKKWHDVNPKKPFTMAINIAPQQIINKQFIEVLKHALQQIDTLSQNIELEIAESTFLKIDPADPVLNDIKASGVKITIDNFGKGFSSLERLKKLPINSLKIDSSFVRDIPKEKTNTAIIRSIINIGKELGLEVIAEGIETEPQLTFLLELGCDVGQGFYFSKPLKTEEMTEFLIRHLSSQKILE